jgi:hypothetical protein
MALIGSVILDNAAHRRPGSEAVFFRVARWFLETADLFWNLVKIRHAHDSPPSATNEGEDCQQTGGDAG